MAKYVGLMRGINVGGNRIVKMAKLRDVLTGAGFHSVQTYVQSGNIVLESDGDETTVRTEMETLCSSAFGFDIPIILRPEDVFRAEAAACPYAGPDGEPLDGRLAKFLQLTYLSALPDMSLLEDVLTRYRGPEEVSLQGSVLYVYYPEGAGRSELANHLTPKKLGATPTSRNWNTVQKLLGMLAG